ncbi:MAG: zinc-ribbon domain-containing protein [Treponema sp.]|nr:zinc-ribbon domain-containing protein [Treponema sp.]
MVCQKCNSEISDGTKFCPNCGVEVLSQTSSAKIRTPLSAVLKNSGTGTFYKVAGVLGILIGIPMISIVIGIFFIIGGILCFIIGGSLKLEKQTGTCPYCNNPVTVVTGQLTYKCIHCKRISNQRSDYLEEL